MAVFLAAGAFFGAAAVLVFFGAAFFAAVVVFGLVSFASFCYIVSSNRRWTRCKTQTFGAAGLAAAGLASFFASFTGPDGPGDDTCQHREHCVLKMT